MQQADVRRIEEGTMLEIRSEIPLLVAFVDLTRFGAQSQRVDDVQLADGLDAYYEEVGAAVQEGGGRVVKFVGDGAVLAFPEDRVDRGVEMLLALKESVDRSMAQRGWECRLIAKAHFGTAIAGPFGEAGAKRHDVIGKAVNTAAMLDATGVTLSVAAFRRLSPALRRRFKKHTPPITYIRLEDPRRFRGASHS
jgi:adenylate cyclase